MFFSANKSDSILAVGYGTYVTLQFASITHPLHASFLLSLKYDGQVGIPNLTYNLYEKHAISIILGEKFLDASLRSGTRQICLFLHPFSMLYEK